MPESVVVGENGNGVLLGEWPKLLMSGDLTPFFVWTLCFAPRDEAYFAGRLSMLKDVEQQFFRLFLRFYCVSYLIAEVLTKQLLSKIFYLPVC